MTPGVPGRTARKRCRRILAGCGLLLAASAFAAALLIRSAGPAVAAAARPAPAVEAGESVYLAELNEDGPGVELLAQNADAHRPVASTTKMMTALLLLESGWDLSETLTVPERLSGELQSILACGGVGMQLQVGETLCLRDLFYGMVVASANDAASTIADALSDGDTAAFVHRMNERAAQLGCTDTNFTCPHGLYESGSYSTARDLAKVAAVLRQNETYMAAADAAEYLLPATNRREALHLAATNRLLCPGSKAYYAAAHGMKTGYTSAAGRCLVTTATDPRTGRSCVLVLLGAGEDTEHIYREAVELLRWALQALRADIPEPERSIAA